MYFITTKRMLEVCFSAHPNIQYRTFVFYRYAGSPGNPFFVRQGGADRLWNLFLAGGRRILPELIRDHFNHLCLQIHVKGQLADKSKQLQIFPVLVIHRSI